MLTYTIKDIERLIYNILDVEPTQIIPIGNHELKRHLVFCIECNHKKLILKLYYKANNASCEMAALKKTYRHGVKVPELISGGSFEGVDWILIGFREGKTLQEVWDQISFENLEEIFQSIGHEFKKIHNISFGQSFNSWDKNKKHILGFDSYKDQFLKNIDGYHDKISKKSLYEKDLMLEGLDTLYNKVSEFEDIEEPRLVHNDFSARNIIVRKKKDKWVLNAIIDFENSMAGNLEEDLAVLYQKHFLDNKALEKSFFDGYGEINSKFFERLDIYLLKRSLDVCTWANQYAPAYYRENINIIKEILKKEN